jgi:hypothetical protein
MKNSIHFTSLILVMLVTGVFWGTWFTLTRSIEDFSAAEFIHIGKVIIANVAWPMRILMPSCLLMMLWSLLIYIPKKSKGFYFNIAAFALMITTLLITLLVLVPIDNQIKEWTAEHVPADWEALRMRWKSYHAARTFTSVSSFCCFAASRIFR